MKKILSLIIALAVILSVCSAVTAADNVVFVAPNGNDSNSGTIDSPVKTLEKAVSMANGGTVVLREGKYNVSKTVELSAKDSGLTITGYAGEKAEITGSNKLEYKDFKKVTDENILGRIVNKSARDKIVAYDLKAAGIENYGFIAANGRGVGWEDKVPSSELYVGDDKQVIARYPNGDEYLYISEVIEEGGIPRDQADPPEGWKGKGFKIRVNDSRIDNWKNAEKPMIFGYFMHDWAEGRANIKIDFDNKNIISTEYPSTYGVTTNRRVYFFNLLEELDSENEWWLDSENGIIYLYPGESFKEGADIEYVTGTDLFINIDGAKDVTVKNLTFARNLGGAVNAVNADGLTIADCEAYSITATVFEARGSNIQIVSNYIHDVGGTAIYLEGGDRITLTSSNNLICNNKIVRFQQVNKTGNYGIYLQGVGGTISHNYLSECASIAILYYGNNHTVEYNDVSKACLETSDQGAIYSGRNWTCRGNKIRYNYIHDMKMIDATTSYTIQGVYLDDMHSSTEVYGNVFYNLRAVTLYGGGRNNTFVNNVMIDCTEPFVYDHRGLDWMDTSENSQLMTRLKDMPYKTGIWAETYPELVNILDDDPNVPKYAVIKNNISYNVPDYDLAPEVTQYGTFENNFTVKNTSCFKDYRNHDFTILKDSEVYKLIPDFEDIPFSEMGLLTDKLTEKENESVALLIGSPKAIAKGKSTFVDPDNTNVQPLISDGRTLVPVRFIAESFGADVDWNGDTKTVTVKNGGKEINLTLGSAEITVDGTKSALDVPAQSIEGRTMVPLRAIVEALGKEVFWDDKGLIVMSDSALIEEGDSFTVDHFIRKMSIN